jgi:hypothetical protein
VREEEEFHEVDLECDRVTCMIRRQDRKVNMSVDLEKTSGRSQVAHHSRWTSTAIGL